MGVSSDGLLFWGVLVEEDEAPWEAEEFDFDRCEWEKHACALLGYPDKDDLYDLKDAVGVSCGIHCSYDYPMYYIAAHESEQTANRGYPVDAKFEVGPDWEAKVRSVCGKLGITCENPRWILASVMG